MNSCVVFGNLWLLAALVLMVGRTIERVGPTMYSFFGFGAGITP